MIYGNIKDLAEYDFLEEAVKECFAYAAANDLMAFEKGSHQIDGERLYVNLAEYTTTGQENRFWEAHRKYLDVHLMLRGTERIDVNRIGNMKLKDYVEADDFLPMDGEKKLSAVLTEGDFLICFPSDGHRTGVAVAGPQQIKKAIFKVRI